MEDDVKVIKRDVGNGFDLAFTIPEEFWSIVEKQPPEVQQAITKILEELVGMVAGILGRDFLMDLSVLTGKGPDSLIERILAHRRGEKLYALVRLHADLMAHLREMQNTTEPGRGQSH